MLLNVAEVKTLVPLLGTIQRGSKKQISGLSPHLKIKK